MVQKWRRTDISLSTRIAKSADRGSNVVLVERMGLPWARCRTMLLCTARRPTSASVGWCAFFVLQRCRHARVFLLVVGEDNPVRLPAEDLMGSVVQFRVDEDAP